MGFLDKALFQTALFVRMIVSRQTVLVRLLAMLHGRDSVFFAFFTAAMVIVVSRFTMMVSGLFVMHCRFMMVFARIMFAFGHDYLQITEWHSRPADPSVAEIK